MDTNYELNVAFLRREFFLRHDQIKIYGFVGWRYKAPVVKTTFMKYEAVIQNEGNQSFKTA